MEDGKKKLSWSWLPDFMPKVAGLIQDRRKQDGAEWVAHCWRESVVMGKPGFFWAAEGAVAIGVPVDAKLVEMHHALALKAPGTATMDMARKPEGWTHVSA